MTKDSLHKDVGTADILKTRMRTIDSHEVGRRQYNSVASKNMKGIKTYVGGG